jgi:transcriptional regulator with XRE-family HTH domain
MVEVYMPYTQDLKALHILRLNVRAGLLKRGESEAQLATNLGFKHRSSLNKFLNSERAGFQMRRLDKMAAFFGVAVYQLFQPGTSELTDRRHSQRRSGQDRRIGHQYRHMTASANTIEDARPHRRGQHDIVPDSVRTIRQLLRDLEREFTTILSTQDARRQAAAARTLLAKTRARTGTTSRQTPEKT